MFDVSDLARRDEAWDRPTCITMQQGHLCNGNMDAWRTCRG